MSSSSRTDTPAPTSVVGQEDTAESRLQRLKAALEGGKRLTILTHDNPDPDALASAYALLRLVEEIVGITARIGFGGIVGRAENRTMVQELELPVTPARDLDFEEVDLIALVDTQPGTGNNSLPEGRQAAVVIDHHPRRPETDTATYSDVRPECGATCTILYEYLNAAGIPVEGVMATALFYAIQSETQDLGREVAQRDIEASLELYPAANRELLARIRYPRVPRAYFKSLHKSLETSRTRGPVVISMLGECDYPDLVAELADLYLRLEGTEWSVVLGRYGSDLLISLRTTDPHAAAGRVLRRVVGALGSAGGHGMTAGARLPVADLSAEDARLRAEEVVNRFLKELGVEDETGGSLLD